VSTDPRLSVALGLRRLVDRGEWPTEHLVAFQNLLLDECGGDTRPLVMLLMRAVEQGIAEDIANLDTTAWEERRPQFITRMMANAFVQGEMARWAVHAWAYAFGLIATPWIADPPEPVLPPGGEPARATAGTQRWSPPSSSGSGATVTRYVPPAQRRRFGLYLASTWVQSTTPLSPQDRRRDRIMFIVVVSILITLAVPAMYLARKRAPQMAMDAATLAAQIRASQPKPPKPTPANGEYSGVYRVERTLETVTGDPACTDGSAAVHWPVPTIETIAYDSTSRTFQFLSRPEVRGRVSPEGNMEAGPVYGRKDGTDYAFWMAGRFTPEGFEARAQTTTRTVISWVIVERCRLTGRLSAHRVK
jgi:hypothetical protein